MVPRHLPGDLHGTGVDLPAEAKGSVRHWKQWRPVDLAAAGFGQSVGVTALQLTTAVAAIANGGAWIQPVLAKGFLNQDGLWLPAHEVKTPRQVIHKKTASLVRDMMVEVTKPGGTGIPKEAISPRFAPLPPTTPVSSFRSCSNCRVKLSIIYKYILVVSCPQELAAPTAWDILLNPSR